MAYAIGMEGEIVAFYASARECSRKNSISRQCVTDHCNGKRDSAFAIDGFAYAWEDSKVSMRQKLDKIAAANAYRKEA